MEFTLVSLVAAFLIRMAALYVALTRAGFWKLEPKELVLLATFSTLLGVIMPATGLLDVTGALFRLLLFSIILVIFMRMEIADALGATFVAAIIEAVAIFALSISPISWAVAGMSWLAVP
ncbi:MAG: hypothetical protein JW834_01235 [Candidatus Diapherotrites archaeon]|nr:hypothetical protein [Candidatus Diapherotrites archaeon]